MAICDKTTTNKWTYKRSHKSLNSYSLVEYNKIYPNTNSWKNLQEESLWQEDFDNLYFWSTLNKTHQGILVWNKNKRLHTIIRSMCIKKKKRNNTCKDRWITYINIYVNPNISTMYVIWSKTYIHEVNVKKKKRKYIKISLHPS